MDYTERDSAHFLHKLHFARKLVGFIHLPVVKNSRERHYFPSDEASSRSKSSLLQCPVRTGHGKATWPGLKHRAGKRRDDDDCARAKTLGMFLESQWIAT